MSASPTSEPEPDFVCACKERMRSACAGEPFYQEHEGKRYCVLHCPSKEKSADFGKALQRKLENKDFDFQGAWFPDASSFSEFDFSADANFEGATFSAHADFGYATFSAHANFSYATFEAEANFDSVTFSAEAYFYSATFYARAFFRYATFSAEANFRDATFSAEADFYNTTFKAEAVFSDATFSWAAHFVGAAFKAESDFSGATFRSWAHITSATFGAEANFKGATFSAEADFGYATFSAEADFSSATFGAEEAHFRYVTFSAGADFSAATFAAVVDFRYATFANIVRIAGDEKHQVFTDASRLDLQFARIEKPDRVSFHTLSLRPHWFVNIDARKFAFTNVNWGGLSINEEISRLEQNDISSPHPLLAIACGNLAVNAEENQRYEEASTFRYMAMEARRLESWHGFAPWRLSWWYWFASGYGERILRALVVFIGIWLLFAVLYREPQLRCGPNDNQSTLTCIGWEKKDPNSRRFETFSSSLMYTLEVMTLQKPDPHPESTLAHLLVALCSILGPLQAALLALAIRRKFMR